MTCFAVLLCAHAAYSASLQNAVVQALLQWGSVGLVVDWLCAEEMKQLQVG